jgi:nitroreductase
MDTFLAIASKRDTRSYAPAPIPPDAVTRILEAGRVAGSARNRQPWRFLIVVSDEARRGLSDAVYVRSNVLDAGLVVAVIGRSSFDVGRAAQNMMLAAWNEAIASCPNGLADADAGKAALRLGGDDEVATVLSFGYPARPRSPGRRSPAEWIARADRKALDDLVGRV